MKINKTYSQMLRNGADVARSYRDYYDMDQQRTSGVVVGVAIAASTGVVVLAMVLTRLWM